MSPLPSLPRAGLLLVLLAFATTPVASLAEEFEAYMFVEGASQGRIEGWGSWPGEDDAEGVEGAIRVLSYSHRIVVPRDPQSGLAGGRRVHHPLTVRTRFDRATPKLYQALVTGERLVTVEIGLFRTGAKGRERYATVELEDAQLVGVSAVGVGPQGKMDTLVTMTYRKIIWTWEEGGVQTEDDWAAG